MKLSTLNAVVLALAFPVLATAGTISVNYRHLVSPTAGFQMEDADIRQNAPNTTSETSNINLGTLNAGGNQRMRSVMSFDLDAAGGLTLADSNSIDSVTLSLVIFARHNLWTSLSASQRLIELRLLTNNFSESSVTWNSPWANPGGDFGATVLSSVTENLISSVYTFPSTPAFVAAAQDALINNNGVLNLILLTPNAETLSATGFVEFYSSDRPGASAEPAGSIYRPLLIVQIPEPGAALLLGVGGLLLWRRRPRME